MRELKMSNNLNMDSKTLSIWDDGVDRPVSSSETVYCWNGYGKTEAINSVPDYIESNAEQLREKYLAFIHDIGENQIDGQRLLEHLVIEDDLSFWWLSLFVEKSLYKSPITESIRVLALGEIINQHKPHKLKFVSANRKLHEVLCDLCQRSNIEYIWEKLPEKTAGSSVRKIVLRILPDALAAIISLLRYSMARWSFRKSVKTGWSDLGDSIFLCSQFTNVAPEALNQGTFKSDLWNGLPELLKEKNIYANWLQLYIPHAAVADANVAIDHVNRFNRLDKGDAFHIFLDAELSLLVLLRAIKQLLGLNIISWRLAGKIKEVFRVKENQLLLWPFMKKDWQTSIRGQIAISNLLWIELLKANIKKLPHQKLGLYLCENQAWERVLCHFWHKYGHGQLIAVAHSTVRYWDLRHYSDPRTIRTSAPYRLPCADFTALNGRAAVDAYLKAKFPKESIVESEALRYGHLNKLASKYSTKHETGDSIKVLILGDYTSNATIQMLQLLENAVPYITDPIIYTMKPHPNFVVKAEDYPSINMAVTMEPLGKILHDYDVAYSSNMTSAAVDAHLAGLPSVVVLDKTGLNFSPLRGQSHVFFVTTAKELADALKAAYRAPVTSTEKNDFFFLDPDLPRWQKLLHFAQ